MPIRYQHTQVGWLMIAIGGPAMLLGAAIALRESWVAGLVFSALGTIVLLTFFCLTTTVSDGDVHVRFGVGLIRRRVPLARIAAVTAVRNHWIYGWGIRLIPSGWLWNVSGFGGVELALINGRRFRIGTDEPEQLAAAIRAAVGKG